jgi:hypothetical protein
MARDSARSTIFLNAAKRAARSSGLSLFRRVSVFDAKSDAASSIASVDFG